MTKMVKCEDGRLSNFTLALHCLAASMMPLLNVICVMLRQCRDATDSQPTTLHGTNQQQADASRN